MKYRNTLRRTLYTADFLFQIILKKLYPAARDVKQ